MPQLIVLVSIFTMYTRMFGACFCCLFLCFFHYCHVDIHQLNLIMEVLGTPSAEFMQRISSESARMYIQSLPVLKKRNFSDVFKGANPSAIDLLEKMLELDPGKRITAEQALAHPYLAQYADPSDEPSSQPYDESFEHMELTVEKWKELVYEEVANFKPVCFPVPRESA